MSEKKVEVYQGFAVLKCYRKRHGGSVLTESCPFCGSSHIHGLLNGETFTHRVAHCVKIPPIEITTDNGEVLSNLDGYYLRLEN